MSVKHPFATGVFSFLLFVLSATHIFAMGPSGVGGGTGGKQTLADLNCLNGQIPEYDAINDVWVCGEGKQGSNLVLMDSDEPPKQVGMALSQRDNPNFVVTILKVFDSQGRERNILLGIQSDQIRTSQSILFEERDCSHSGSIWVRTNAGLQPFLSIFKPGIDQTFITKGFDINDDNWGNQRRLYIITSDVAQNVVIQSKSGNIPPCVNTSQPENHEAFPVELLDEDLHTTFPPPDTFELK